MNAVHFKMHQTGIRIAFLVISVLFLTGLGKAQLYLSNFEKFGLGLGTRSLQPLILEARIGTNNRLKSTRMEAAVMYEFDDQTYHTVSAGVALALDPFEEQANFGFTILAQLEIFPIPDFRRFGLFIELGPEFLVDFDETGLRHNWGFRYYFADND